MEAFSLYLACVIVVAGWFVLIACRLQLRRNDAVYAYRMKILRAADADDDRQRVWSRLTFLNEVDYDDMMRWPFKKLDGWFEEWESER